MLEAKIKDFKKEIKRTNPKLQFLDSGHVPEGPIQGLGSICLFCFCLIFQFESFLEVFVYLFF